MTRFASLLGGLGVVAVAFGLLSVLAAVFQPITEVTSYVIFGNLILGVLMLSAALFLGFDQVRDRIRSGGTRRAGRYGGNALLAALLSIVILGMVGFFTQRHRVEWDWTADRLNTLTSQTLSLLDRIDRPTHLQAFFAESEIPFVAAMLGRYARASPFVTLEFIDPNSEPMLVQELELDPEWLARGLVRVSMGEAAIVVPELGEDHLTNALLRLQRAGARRVYFLEGHNERRIEGADGRPAEKLDTIGRAAEAVRNEVYEVIPLSLTNVGEVPGDAAAVIVAGPTRPYFDHEIAALRAYLRSGGGLFVMIDPRAQTNLYGLLEEVGIAMGDDVVVDQALAVFGQATSPLAADYAPSHPITREIRETGETSVFPMVRSVEPPLAADGSGPGAFTPLVLTSRDSWAERDLDGWMRTGRTELSDEDLVGPVPVAVAGEVAGSGDRGGRLVVFGDSDFITNRYLDQARNRDLFLNSVNWLVGDVEQISLRPNSARASTFTLDADSFRRIQYVSLLFLPEAIALCGVLAWWKRRDRLGDPQ